MKLNFIFKAPQDKSPFDSYYFKMPSKCKHQENNQRCTKYASYGNPGTTERQYCKTHARSGMVITKKDSRLCTHPEHKENKENPPRASFGLPGEKPIRCKKHVERGMVSINLKNPCEICGIKARTHGSEDGKKRFCQNCAKLSQKNLKDLRNGKCIECEKWAVFGFEGKGRTHCKKHKEDGMIDLKNGKCKICVKNNVLNPKQPTFGYDKAICCKEHKENDMKDLKHNNSSTCEKCTKRATFGWLEPIRCKKHRDFGMEAFYGQKCVKCGEKQGTFGLKKGGPLYCLGCKHEEMKRIKGQMCVICGAKQPVFNFEGKKAKYCGDCKDPFMIDVVNPRCQSCKKFIVTAPKKFCAYCDPDCLAFKKLKEKTVLDFLQENLEEKIVHNKKISSKEKIFPDFRIYPVKKTHTVIIETDEYQHKKGYDEACENQRMKCIAEAENVPCIFLRYNPDIFRINGKKIIIPGDERLKFLLEKVQKFLKKKTFKKNMYVYRLFYDCSIDDVDESEQNALFFQEYDLEEYFEKLNRKIEEENAKDALEKVDEENDEENNENANENDEEENDEDI